MTPRRAPRTSSQRRAASARLAGRIGFSWNTPLTLRVILALAALAGACYGAFQLWAGRILGGAAPAPFAAPPPPVAGSVDEEKKDRRREEEKEKRKKKRPTRDQPRPEPDPDHDARAPEEVAPAFQRYINCPGGGRDDPRLCPSARPK